MLTIEYADATETIKVGDLFNELGFNSSVESNDVDGDSLIKNNWPIEVLSLDGFYPIDGFRWTKPERQVKLTVETSDDQLSLICSPEHLVLQQKPNEWCKVGNLRSGDHVVTKNKIATVVSVESLSEVTRLCDMQVAIAHSYYANGVLSHNSHWLTYVGANAMRAGLNVLHYTFELSETQVGVRYDSNLCDINSTHVIENKDTVLEKYKSMNSLGRLFIKQYPPNFATIYTIRSHVERLSITKGFIPNLVIIDYADIMRSSRQYDSLRHELKLVYEELRGFAIDLCLPIWTASQSNKEGSSSDIVDLSNMSEAYGKAMVADVVISLSRKPQEKASGWGRLFVAKNRAGRDGILYPIRIDTSKSQFEITGGAGDLSEERLTDEAQLKKDIARRISQVKTDPDIQTRSATNVSELEPKILSV